MKDISTLAVHAGEISPRIEGAISMPVFQSANFEFHDEGDYANIKYARLNNTPNHLALHAKLAALENGEDALVLASGMAAISTTLLALLSKGDRILTQKTLYGGTFSLLAQELARFGIEADVAADENWEAKIRPETRMIYAETISNPLMEVPDFQKVLATARKHKLISVIDNTFASPVNFKPIDLGFDLSLHSATKYLNGHSDLIAGCVIGSKARIKTISHTAAHLGATLDPHGCSLLHRGLKTLGVRVERQNQTALRLADFLSHHENVATVNYPGLPSHPAHSRAREYFKGFGGMLSFELKNPSQVESFLGRLKIPVLAASLGGVESLVIIPARSSHLSLTAEERRQSGITDGLIRFSTGLEGADDLIADLKQALG